MMKRILSFFLTVALSAALLAPGAAAVNEAVAKDTDWLYITIDPGHGGNDPGAHYGGTSEKDLTLKVALKLGKMIEEGMPGVKVVYTRKTDKALGLDKAKDLQARADIANKAGGDLFISIHVNAAKSPPSTAEGKFCPPARSAGSLLRVWAPIPVCPRYSRSACR